MQLLWTTSVRQHPLLRNSLFDCCGRHRFVNTQYWWTQCSIVQQSWTTSVRQHPILMNPVFHCAAVVDDIGSSTPNINEPNVQLCSSRGRHRFVNTQYWWTQCSIVQQLWTTSGRHHQGRQTVIKQQFVYRATLKVGFNLFKKKQKKPTTQLPERAVCCC